MIAVIVDAEFVAAHLDGLVADLPGDVLVADVRWYLDGRDGRAAYEHSHLPGAVWVDLDRHLAAHDRPAVDGRHPLPTPEAFAASMGQIGIGDDTTVIAYDDTGGMTAGRLVVMLRVLGIDAAVLDGGLAAWTDAAEASHPRSGRVQSGWVEPTPRSFTPRPWPAGRFATADEAGDAAAAGRPVLDARSAERFRGEVALIDARPGHIPGARNAPWNAVLDDTGRFRSPDELRRHYAALAADTGEVIASCGSGVSACMNLIAMEHAGLQPARLFTASWSGWSADPERPVELGA